MTSGKVLPGRPLESRADKGQGAGRMESRNQCDQAGRELYRGPNCTVSGLQGNLGQGTQAPVLLCPVEWVG